MSLDISNKIEFLQCENKLLMNQQTNYKDLCKVLTERHVEILKYLTHLKEYIEKLLAHSKENVIYNSYLNDKNQRESIIFKYDKQIQLLTQCIQSSQAQISDSEEILFKEQLKLLSSSLDTINHSTIGQQTTSLTTANNLNLGNSFTKYRCEYFECSEEFTSKEHLENHFRAQHSTTFTFSNSMDGSNNHYVGFNNGQSKKGENESKINEILFLPQMELEVLEYSNQGYSTVNSIQTSQQNQSSNDQHQQQTIVVVSQQQQQQQSSENHVATDKGGGYKKMSLCDYCGKYFNKHYLESHKRSHTGVKPFKCSVNGCNRTFTQSSSRNFHEKRFHSGTKFPNVFKCAYQNCESTFDRMENFKEHMLQHQTMTEQAELTSAISLVQIKNEEITQSEAPEKQQQTFADNDSIKANSESNINQQQQTPILHKHLCGACGKSFPYKIALRQHSLMHGEKNYRCPYENCSYASYWKHNLNLHLRKQHDHNTESQ